MSIIARSKTMSWYFSAPLSQWISSVIFRHGNYAMFNVRQ